MSVQESDTSSITSTTTSSSSSSLLTEENRTKTSKTKTESRGDSEQTQQYIPPWQLWLIRKSKLLKSSAWNIIIWVLLILGFLIFQAIAWKTYWLSNETTCYVFICFICHLFLFAIC